MSRRVVVRVLACAGIASLSYGSPPPTVNIVAEAVRPIKRLGSSSDPGLLLVYVVDQDGVALAGVDITLVDAKGGRLKGKTVKDGTALLRLSATGHFGVRASLRDYTPSEARDVLVKANGLTSVALSLESAQE